MIELLKASQIALSVLITILVLLQPKDAGLSASLAGQAGATAKFERRGASKGLHVLTVIVAALLVANATAYFLLA
jgi:protein translocase SecG subunit